MRLLLIPCEWYCKIFSVKIVFVFNLIIWILFATVHEKLKLFINQWTRDSDNIWCIIYFCMHIYGLCIWTYKLILLNELFIYSLIFSHRCINANWTVAIKLLLFLKKQFVCKCSTKRLKFLLNILIFNKVYLQTNFLLDILIFVMIWIYRQKIASSKL